MGVNLLRKISSQSWEVTQGFEGLGQHGGCYPWQWLVILHWNKEAETVRTFNKVDGQLYNYLRMLVRGKTSVISGSSSYMKSSSVDNWAESMVTLTEPWKMDRLVREVDLLWRKTKSLVLFRHGDVLHITSDELILMGKMKQEDTRWNNCGWDWHSPSPNKCDTIQLDCSTSSLEVSSYEWVRALGSTQNHTHPR